MHCLVSRRVWQGLIAIAEPLLHELDLVALRGIDSPGHVDQLGMIRTVGHQGGHLKGLVVVWDHIMHEPDVIRRVIGLGDRDRLIGTELSRRLSRCAWLDDGRTSQAAGRADDRQSHERRPQAGTLKLSSEGYAGCRHGFLLLFFGFSPILRDESPGLLAQE